MRLALIASALLAAAFDIGLSTAPRPLFRDIAGESGLDFHHVSGAGGEYLMPEIMGSGGALLDYDNDGDLDVYLIQGSPLETGKPLRVPVPPGTKPGNRLFKDMLTETGALRFVDVTDKAGVGYTGLGISRSADGASWATPVFAARNATVSLAYDKEWISCDNAPASPYYGNCYLAYTDIAVPRIAVQSSRDGGATWGAPVTVTALFGADAVGALPLVQPDGALTGSPGRTGPAISRLGAWAAEGFQSDHRNFDLSESLRSDFFGGAKGSRTPEITPFRAAGLLPPTLLGPASPSHRPRCSSG